MESGLPLTDVSTRPATVLAVDDEQVNLDLVEAALSPHGFRVLFAHNGLEALSTVFSQDVDVVLLDIMMPGVDGYEVCRRIKSNEATRRIPVVMISGLGETGDRVEGLSAGANDFITKPFNVYELVPKIRNLLTTKFLADQLEELNRSLEDRVRERTQALEKARQEREELYGRLQAQFVDTLRVFAGLIELRDRYVGSHSKRVGVLCHQVAQAMGLPVERVFDIELAGVLHDIGKIGMPDALLAKIPTDMTEEEMRIYQRHPVLGQATLHVVDWLQEPGLLVRHHHENLDGTGHPDGLAGEAIPQGSRIIAAVNAYDAATYRPGLLPPSESPLGWVKRQSGKQFDPAVVEVLARVLEAATARRRPPVVALSPAQLEPGMQIAEDVYTEGGVLLAAAEETLTPSFIESIRQYALCDHVKGPVRVYKGE